MRRYYEDALEGFVITPHDERFFALYDAEYELVCVTVYKRGAAEVRRRLILSESNKRRENVDKNVS